MQFLQLIYKKVIVTAAVGAEPRSAPARWVGCAHPENDLNIV